MNQINNLEDKKKKGAGKKMLLMLALVFVLPFTIAATLHILDIRPSGKSFGNLVNPPIALNIPAFPAVNDTTFPADRWEKIWSVVMIDNTNCAEVCQSSLDTVKRVHTSLHKEVKRVQRILILQDRVDRDQLVSLQATFPNLIILADDGTQNSFISHFINTAPTGSVYLVDPLSNLMMHYPQAVSPKELRADLKRLLKNSWGG